MAAALTAGDQEALAQALAGLPEEQRATVMAQLQQMAEESIERRSPEERAALVADQASAAATNALRGGDKAARQSLAQQVLAAADHYGADEQPGSPYDELAAFLRAVAALLRGEDGPAVPTAYSERFAALATIEPTS